MMVIIDVKTKTKINWKSKLDNNNYNKDPIKKKNPNFVK
jgi:hypothetical protein